MNELAGSAIEVVLFARDQGNFLGGCFASIRRAAAYAMAKGADVAFTAVLQASTPLTLRMVECNVDEHWHVLDLPEASLDQARNAARRALRMPLVAFVDGYDLWCETWLHAVCAAAQKGRAVWRPEVLLTFGNDSGLSAGYSAIFQPLHLSNPSLLLVSDPLPSGFAAPRKIFECCAWPAPDPERGWAAIDRWWNCEVAAAGYEHRAIHSTFHYRRRPEALLKMPRTPLQSGPDRIGPTRLAMVQMPRLTQMARTGFALGDDDIG